MMRRLPAHMGLATGLVVGIALLTTPVVSANNRTSLPDGFSMTVDVAQVAAGVTGSATGGSTICCSAGGGGASGGGGNYYYPTVSDPAPLVAGVTALLAMLALYLPVLLRASRTPAEAEKIASSEGSDGAGEPPDGARTAGTGPRHPGSGETSPQPMPTAPSQAAPSQATATPTATSSPFPAQTPVHGGAQPGSAQPQTPTPAHHPAAQHPHPSATSPAQHGNDSASGSALDLPNLPDTPDVPESPETFEPLLAAQIGTRADADEADGVEAAVAAAHKAREYAAGALAQMQALDVSAARVEDVIRRGGASAGPQPGTTVYAAPENDLLVTVEASTGTVVAVERRGV